MKSITSYKVKIVDHNDIFKQTVDVYRAAIKFIVSIVNAHYDDAASKTGKEKNNFVERLIHTTKFNEAECDFDAQFVKFPSYLRRAAISEAIGIVSSYRSNLANWDKNKAGKPPRLALNHFVYPALYKDNTFVRVNDYIARIKIYHQKDWVWLPVKLRKGDVDYITRRKTQAKETVPTLIRHGKQWHLRFAFIEKAELNTNNLYDQIAVAVDLGINNAATMCAMLSDGTVVGRKIISLPKEKDHLRRALGYIKKAQCNGNYKTPRLWAYANGANKDISAKAAQAIMDFAVLYNASVIVFEALDTQGKKRGSKKQRLALWRHQEMQRIVTTRAHLCGMRISRVCAWNTSKLAFDGSGVVERCVDGNYSVCRFATGKLYHADLNAAYNIGARYFIRGIEKTIPEKEWLAIKAKVPSVAKRTTRILSDLINLSVEITPIAA